MQKKIAVITGITGCIGYHTTRKLIQQGWEVIALHRKSTRLELVSDLNITFKCVDFYSKESLAQAIPAHIDALFHPAASVSHFPDTEQELFNVTTTRLLAEIALERNARFIFTSTGATLNYKDCYDLEIVNRIKSGYVRTKRLAEIEVHNLVQQGLNATTLQPIIVLGTHDFQGNYSTLFTKKDLRAALPGKLEFCDVQMVAQAHVDAYDRGKQGESYVLGGEFITWFELFTIIATITGAKKPQFVPPKIILYLTGYIELGLFYITGRRPELTPDLVDLIGDEEGLTKEEANEAKEILGYDRELVHIEKTCRDVYEWVHSTHSRAT